MPAAPRRGTRFTLGGGIFVIISLLIGAAAVQSQANLLFLLFGLTVGSLVVAYLLGWIVLRGVWVQRILPGGVNVGHPVEILYRLHNRKRLWRSFSIHVEVPSSFAIPFIFSL